MDTAPFEGWARLVVHCCHTCRTTLEIFAYIEYQRVLEPSDQVSSKKIGYMEYQRVVEPAIKFQAESSGKQSGNPSLKRYVRDNVRW